MIYLDAAPAWFAPALTPILNAAIARGNAPLLAAIAQVSTTTYTMFCVKFHDFRFTTSSVTTEKIANTGFSRLRMDPCQLIHRCVFLSVIFFTYLTRPVKNDLPGLRNSDNVKNLLPQQCDAYLAGYGLPHVHIINERKRCIGREIGCPVSVVN
jgi:hypothetical protein